MHYEDQREKFLCAFFLLNIINYYLFDFLLYIILKLSLFFEM